MTPLQTEPRQLRLTAPEQQALQLPGAEDLCQRWHERTPTWRRTSEGGFDPGLHRVVAIAEGPARRFVEIHHYSGSWPAVRFVFGLQRVDEPPGPGEPAGGRLLGVLSLGIPMNGAVLDVFEGTRRYTETLELNRLVLLDRAESNAESWFCARAFTAAAQQGIRGVVAHSDPHPRVRRTPEGGTELLSPGHIGHVYAAQDFVYLGRTRPRKLTVLPDATVLSDRTVAKIKGDEVGHRGAERRLVEFGATPRRSGQPGRDWLVQALEEISATVVHHGGNHRYARAIGPRRTPIIATACQRPRHGRTGASTPTGQRST
ncbi:hypothetical protein ACIQNI_34435 [Streptomyces sp. NPDC091266]|uniref:Mom family adenine methylcarbamoylation protein n=1 Tax=Streptomyces sp. NPDC091266 TaxID=3365978 RepID=UPI00380026EE